MKADKAKALRKSSVKFRVQFTYISIYVFRALIIASFLQADIGDIREKAGACIISLSLSLSGYIYIKGGG